MEFILTLNSLLARTREALKKENVKNFEPSKITMMAKPFISIIRNYSYDTAC